MANECETWIRINSNIISFDTYEKLSLKDSSTTEENGNAHSDTVIKQMILMVQTQTQCT